MDQKTPFDVIDQSQTYNVEHILPTFSYNVNSSSYNINDIEKIVELIILITGLILNIFVLLSIIILNLMRTPIGCYLINFVICNFIALLDILANVVDRWFHLNFKPDVDYINRVTLLVYVCTITVFSVDQYITFCCSEFSWRITLSEISTAAKGIVVIWCFATIFTAMEFHLYDIFQQDTVINLYTFTTTMYLIMSTIIIVVVGTMIIIQQMENKVRNKEIKSVKNSEDIKLLVGITMVFYCTLIPDRIVTILHYTLSFCCSTITLTICYWVAKFSTILGPLVWIGTSNLLRKCVRNIFIGQCKR